MKTINTYEALANRNESSHEKKISHTKKPSMDTPSR